MEVVSSFIVVRRLSQVAESVRIPPGQVEECSSLSLRLLLPMRWCTKIKPTMAVVSSVGQIRFCSYIAVLLRIILLCTEEVFSLANLILCWLIPSCTKIVKVSTTNHNRYILVNLINPLWQTFPIVLSRVAEQA